MGATQTGFRICCAAGLIWTMVAPVGAWAQDPFSPPGSASQNEAEWTGRIEALEDRLEALHRELEHQRDQAEIHLPDPVSDTGEAGSGSEDEAAHLPLKYRLDLETVPAMDPVDLKRLSAHDITLVGISGSRAYFRDADGTVRVLADYHQAPGLLANPPMASLEEEREERKEGGR